MIDLNKKHTRTVFVFPLKDAMTRCGAVDGLIGCELEAFTLSVVLYATFQQSLLQVELSSVCKNTSPGN